MDSSDFNELEAELNKLAEELDTPVQVGRLIDLSHDLKTLAKKAGDMRVALDKRIKEALMDNDITGANGNSRKVTLVERSFYGIRQGENEHEFDQNVLLASQFVDRWGPKQVKPNTTSIKKALEAFQMEHPGEVPGFLEEHKDPVLRNLKR